MLTSQRCIAVVMVATVAIAVVAFILWPGDTRRVQGVWTSPAGRLTVDGDLMVLDLPGGAGPRRTYFHLDPSASPKRIVLWNADDPSVVRHRFLGFELGTPTTSSPGGEIRGLYAIDGDVFRVCLSQPGADFPAILDQTGGDVFEFRR